MPVERMMGLAVHSAEPGSLENCPKRVVLGSDSLAAKDIFSGFGSAGPGL